MLRTDGYAWWRSLLGVALSIALYLLLVQVVLQGVVLISALIVRPGVPYAEYARQAQALQNPAGMLGTNLGILCLIPIVFGVMMLVHGVRPRWLGSVRPRLRWKFVAACIGVAAVALGIVQALSVILGPAVALHPQSQYVIFLIIIVLTSPLQAAAEEYFFRGYMLQAFGSIAGNRWFGIVASSLVFALFHGLGQNLAIFVDRFAFGLLAAILVTVTGGLEASIGAHVINNIYAFGAAALTGSVAQARALSQIGWGNAVIDVGGFALFAVLAWLLSRRLKLQTKVTEPEPALRSG
jgi:membrane protease YdiL (CAAX protease family)